MGETRDDATANVLPETPNASAPALQRRSFLDRLAASGHQNPKSNMEKELPAVPRSDGPADEGDVPPQIEGTAGMPERSRSFFDRFGAWNQQNANAGAASAAPASDVTGHDRVSTEVDSSVGAPKRSKSRVDRIAAWGHPDGNHNRTKLSGTSTAGTTDDSYRGSSEVGSGASGPQRTQSRLDRWANLGHKESSRPGGTTSAPSSDAGFTDHDATGVGSSAGVPQRTRSRLDRFADLGHRDGGGWRSPTSATGGDSGVAPSTAVGDLGYSETTEAHTNHSISQRSPSFLDRLAGAGHRDARRTGPIAAVAEESGGADAETYTAVSSPNYSQGGSHAGVEAGVGVPQRKQSILDRLAGSGHQQGRRKTPNSSAAGEAAGPESTAEGTYSATSPTTAEGNANTQQELGSWFGWMMGNGQQSAENPPPATASQTTGAQPPPADVVDSDNGVARTEAGAVSNKPQRRSWLDRVAASGHREGERSATSKALPAVPGEGKTATAQDHDDNHTELDPAIITSTAAGPSTVAGESGGKGGGFKRRLDRILTPQKTRGWFGRRATEQRGEKGLPDTPAGEQ